MIKNGFNTKIKDFYLLSSKPINILRIEKRKKNLNIIVQNY